jgi:hypothetical protein
VDSITIPHHALTIADIQPIAWRRSLRSAIVVYSALGVLLGFAYGSLLSPIVGLISGAAVLVLGLLYLRHPGLARQLRKLEGATMFKEREVRLSQDAYHATYIDGVHSDIPWAAFSRAELIAGVYVINLPGGQYMALPRRVLDADAEQFLTERLRENKLLSD